MTQQLLNNLIFSALVIIFTLIISAIVKKSSDIFIRKIGERSSSQDTIAKARTIRQVIANVLDALIFILAFLLILSGWGINITPLLTGAGIIGLAFSFGAQTLVKDLIAGFFIIIEDQFNIGDDVKVDDIEGTVDRVTLRLTVLKDKKGNYIYIPNSQISKVTRYRLKRKKD